MKKTPVALVLFVSVLGLAVPATAFCADEIATFEAAVRVEGLACRPGREDSTTCATAIALVDSATSDLIECLQQGREI